MLTEVVTYVEEEEQEDGTVLCTTTFNKVVAVVNDEAWVRSVSTNPFPKAWAWRSLSRSC